MTIPPSSRPSTAEEKRSPSAKLSRIFDLLSKRDQTLNATLYEDVEFAGLVRDVYAALGKLHLGGQILSRMEERLKKGRKP